MAGERVRVVTADGQRGTVAADDVDALVRSGGRVFSEQELAAERTQAAYDAQGTAATIGKVASYAGPLPFAAYTAMQATGVVDSGAVLPPEAEAYKQGVAGGFTAGAASLGEKALIEAVAGKTAAHKYGQTALDVAKANPEWHTAGEVAGFAGGAIAGGGAGSFAKALPVGAAGRAAAEGVGSALVKGIPGVAISELGGLAERGVAHVGAGLAARGAIGRALVTGGELALRGAGEGAIYSAAHSATEDWLGDKDLATDKMFASMGTGALFGGIGGAALGTAGSLVASGARGTYSGISKALAKPKAAIETAEGVGGGVKKALDVTEDEFRGTAGDAAAKATAAAREAEAAAKLAARKTAGDVVDNAKAIADEAGVDMAKEGATARAFVDKLASTDAQMKAAANAAWDAVGAGKGLQSTVHVKSAERFLPEGTVTGGKYILKHKILDPEAGVLRTAWNGTPADMVPKLEQRVAAEGARVGEFHKASPAVVSAEAIEGAFDGLAKHYKRNAATEPLGNWLLAFKDKLTNSMGIAPAELRALKPPVWSDFVTANRAAYTKTHGKGTPALQAMSADFRALKAETAAKIATRDAMLSEVPVQDLIRQRIAIDDMVFDTPGAAISEKLADKVRREMRGQLEGLVEDALDAASNKLPGAHKADYKAAKLDYSTAIKLLDLAKDSAARMKKAGVLGLTDTIYGGGSIPKAIAHKVIRERGSAVAAVLLYNMSQKGTITRMVRATEATVDKAVAGITAPPQKRPLPEAASTVPIGERAKRVSRAWAEVVANPDRLSTSIVRHTESMHGVAPELAGGVSQRMTSAVAFMSSKLSPDTARDPFDREPRFTPEQAAKIVRYDSYVQRPARFFEEAAHGKITPEGVEVARALMPHAFADFQQKIITKMADKMARGERIPYAQRERIGVLLDVPAVYALQPAHMSFLQRNVVNSSPAPARAPNRPITSKTQPSPLDRLESK